MQFKRHITGPADWKITSYGWVIFRHIWFPLNETHYSNFKWIKLISTLACSWDISIYTRIYITPYNVRTNKGKDIIWILVGLTPGFGGITPQKLILQLSNLFSDEGRAWMFMLQAQMGIMLDPLTIHKSAGPW